MKTRHDIIDDIVYALQRGGMTREMAAVQAAATQFYEVFITMGLIKESVEINLPEKEEKDGRS